MFRTLIFTREDKKTESEEKTFDSYSYGRVE